MRDTEIESYNIKLYNDVRTAKKNPLEGATKFQRHGRVKDRIDSTVLQKIV